jgi:hypothetical protein
MTESLLVAIDERLRFSIAIRMERAQDEPPEQIAPVFVGQGSGSLPVQANVMPCAPHPRPDSTCAMMS